MLIFTLSFFQLQQEKFRVGLADLSKNFHLFMSCDRAAMFVLHVDTFKARATFAPRSQAVKNKLWSLVGTGKYRSGTEFAVMNSSCYSCRESIKQLKLHKKYIYKSTAIVQVMMTSPYFIPTFLYRWCSTNSRRTFEQASWKEYLIVDWED